MEVLQGSRVRRADLDWESVMLVSVSAVITITIGCYYSSVINSMGLPFAVHFLSFAGKPQYSSLLVHGPLSSPLDSTSTCTLLSCAICWPCAEADIAAIDAVAIARVRQGQEGPRLRLLSKFTKHEVPDYDGIWLTIVWHFSVLGASSRIEPN